MHKGLKVVLGLFTLAVVGIAQWYFMTYKTEPQTPESPNLGPEARGKVPVTHTNLNSNSKLPKGFPKDIPVDVNIVESYKAEYKVRSATQYTVSSLSKRKKEELWAIYENFMKNSFYSIDPSSNKEQGTLIGSKDGDTLMVILSEKEGGVHIQLNYLDRY